MALRPAAALVLIPVAMAAAAAAEPPAAFETEVLPILNRRCTECHGISKQSGGLRLDDYQNLKKGSRKGPVIAPGGMLGSVIHQG